MKLLDSGANRRFVCFLLLVEVLCGGVCFTQELSSNNLAFYLVTTMRTNLQDIVLAPKPLLVDRDFVAYNTNTHEFTITAKAASRFHHEVRGLNVPFVLVANGQRIYLGEFKNFLSSAMPMECPIIDFPDSIENKDFRIGQAMFFPAIPPGAHLIRGDSSNVLVHMPDGSTNVVHEAFPADVRNDPRILAAVRRLFGQEAK
jgi:hypothetical protein